MYTKRELFCSLCGCINSSCIDGKILNIKCSNCSVSIKSTFNNENVLSNYRYINNEIIDNNIIYCENCDSAIQLEFNNFNEARYICQCGYSIYAKKQPNGDLKISSKLIKC